MSFTAVLTMDSKVSLSGFRAKHPLSIMLWAARLTRTCMMQMFVR